jgi:hypothetical protein
MSSLKITQKEIESVPHTRAQLAKWGVKWPPPSGWKEGLIRGHENPNTYMADVEDERRAWKKIYDERWV